VGVEVEAATAGVVLGPAGAALTLEVVMVVPMV
jgi:hypothetical protein